MTPPPPLTFGDIEDTTLPLAVLVHGFPDTPHTWRHLGPDLAGLGYRVVAPWLPGYDAPVSKPVSAGTYVRSLLDVRREYREGDRALLVGHDWGANAGYGVVAADPGAFGHFVALAAPPIGVLAIGIFSYAQLKRSFYIWFIQQVGLAEATLLAPDFWESLWADWSPGYDPREDIAELRRQVCANNIADVICPYRAVLQPGLRRSFCTDRSRRNDAAAAGADAVPARCRRRGDRRRTARRRARTPTDRGIGVRNRRRCRSFPALGETSVDRGEDLRLARRLAGHRGGPRRL